MNMRLIFASRAALSVCALVALPQSASSQPVGEDAPRDVAAKSDAHVEFYNWLYGSSRRNWFEWHTVTASIHSSLAETGFRSRAMGAVGGYMSHIKGAESENPFAAASGLEDNVLPLLDTVGELHGMNGFGGLQFGYTFASENWKISGFAGAAIVRTWAVATRMATGAIKFSTDSPDLNGTRYGVLVSLEGELHPTQELMLSAWSVYTTAYRWGYFEGKAGVALPFRNQFPLIRDAYVGPHAALNMSGSGKQPMLGAHLSGVTIAGVYLNFTAGYTREQTTGNGLYSIVETSWQF